MKRRWDKKIEGEETFRVWGGGIDILSLSNNNVVMTVSYCEDHRV